MKKHLLFLLVVTLAFSALLSAQDMSSILRPPKGATVALMVFEDLQCPDCRRAAPLLEQAGKTYKIPVVRYDYPLPMHNWSYQAAVIGHYFDSQSKQLGVDFRNYIFEHQLEINPNNLRSFAERFAAERKVPLPFVIDPQGKFAAEVNADRELGRKVNLDHTPTIYVVNNKTYVEVKDRSQLYQLIETMRR
jgi:protein-disulfide isomerase